MSDNRSYGTPAAFRRALTDKLKAKAETSRWTLRQLQRQMAYDRLLERLYLVDEGWVVKGATALLARRDAAVALLETFPEDSFDPAAAQALLQNLDEQRDGVARAVGAVAVEGPDAVADSAEYAAVVIEALAGRLRDWVASVVSGEDREELVQSQLRYGRDDQLTVQQQVDGFTAECRKVLHPAESRRPTSRRLRLRR